MTESNHHGRRLQDALRSGWRERPFEFREDFVLLDDAVILSTHVFCVHDAFRRHGFKDHAAWCILDDGRTNVFHPFV